MTIDFEHIFRQYYQPLSYFANSYLQNKEQAEDVVQNVFMRLCNSSEDFESETHIKHYLYKLVRNDCLNEIKTGSIHSEILNQLGQNATNEEDDLFESIVRAEIYGKIIREIDQLPQECGRIFRMAYLENMDNQTIADQLSISINTVKVQKNKAKKRLRERLKGLYPLLFCIFQL